ncbi:arsenate reductase/protein-tyrosine-phosphatase family protein [Rhodococcus sp. B50]|uniref:arsenate reductase/protein-tyrosine-phosphatase family protein n=1 Tax=Rhodococcus sp. B50 TaxID=2682847 RepID=UPI001BD50AC5|nr:low molecular weight phosphatase family protein [Rhodococcus sp. B50]MBS9376121.1 Low molecular weight protein-tyrosine-phosphatase Ptp [Rhodococcus sp. B50]
MHVLFVCAGNVCRSVIAERLTRAYADASGRSDLTAESAGLRALVGYPVEPAAAAVIAGLGADPRDFRARRVTTSMIDRADLILAMTEGQRDRVAALTVGAATKSFTLTEAHRIATVTGADTIARLDARRDHRGAAHTPNIPDPTGLPAGAFVETGDRIAAALLPLLDVLVAAGTDRHTYPVRPERRSTFSRTRTQAPAMEAWTRPAPRVRRGSDPPMPLPRPQPRRRL